MSGKKLYIAILLAVSAKLFAQTGGDNVYEFLNLTHSGLVASLGGTNVSLPSVDLNLVYHNPALLDSGMNRSLALNYVSYFAGINYGMTMYSPPTRLPGYFAVGLTYLNYGSFRETDESGNITGSFSAAEYALMIVYSRYLGRNITIGANLKPVLSHLEKYTSFGLVTDIGISWHSNNMLSSAGFVLKNAGLQLTRYAGEEREKVPFEIQAGFSQSLEHAPFRFSITLRHLEKFDLTHAYDDQGSTETSGNDGFGENLFRHVVLGTELRPHKNFYFAAGYNYQRRRELKVESGGSMTGFSWGFGINTAYLGIGYGRASYHLAGASNHVSIILRPDLLYRKFRKRE